MHRESLSARQALVDMAMGFFRGKALCAAVRLGIADELAKGPVTTTELAAAIQADPVALRRLMRALASIGVVEEDAAGRVALTPFGDPLRRDAPDSAWASMVFWADLLADAWTYLPECVRAGDRAAVDAARAKEGVPSRWSREQDARAIFHSVFAEPAAEDFAPLIGACDLAASTVIADLGGAGGGLLAAALDARPEARGILVDRQGAIEGASARFETSGLAGRCELVVADLLESVPAGADLYLMRCVLHGYDDASALRILENCRRAMSATSRLLLIEIVLPDRIERADPEIERILMSDLNMLVVTGGRERSRAEWEELLASAGLELRGVRSIEGGATGIIEAARP